jgi:hypothetical protein
MAIRYRLLRVASALLLLVVGVAGCQRNQPPQPAPSPNPTPEGAQFRGSAFWASGWTYHLRPLKADAPADAENAKKIWCDLFTGMAKDEKTRELLTRLHAGWPAELIVVEAKQAEDKSALQAPPPDGVAIALRVADLKLTEEKSKAGTVLVRVIAYGRVLRLAGAAVPNSLDQLAEAWKKEPLPGSPLALAMEDYVLRQAPGWVVRGGPVFASEDEKLPASAEDQRRALDQKIKEYADHAKAYYGTPSKP